MQIESCVRNTCIVFMFFFLNKADSIQKRFFIVTWIVKTNF